VRELKKNEEKCFFVSSHRDPRPGGRPPPIAIGSVDTTMSQRDGVDARSKTPSPGPQHVGAADDGSPAGQGADRRPGRDSGDPVEPPTRGSGQDSVRKKSSMRDSFKRLFAASFKKKEPPPEPKPQSPEPEAKDVEEEAPVVSISRAPLLPPTRLTHSAATLVCRERDVRIELLDSLVKEHAQLRANLSLGLAGLHGMSCLVAQEEARGIWLKEAVVVEREAVATIDVLRGLAHRIRDRLTHLDGIIDQGTAFLLRAQTIAKKPRARASIAEQVQALLPDVAVGRLELPDLHSMYILLKAWEANKKGFVVSSDNDGGSFKSPSEMMQFAAKLLKQVLQGRGSDKSDSLTKLLGESSEIVNRMHKERGKGQTEGTQLVNLAQDIKVLDAALENLHDEQYHLEDHLDRALESQVSVGEQMRDGDTKRKAM